MRIDVHPVFSVQIFLDKLHNIELSNRGYYQLRLSAKPNPDLTFELRTEAEPTETPGTPSSSLLPSAIVNGVAISRTLELVFADETLPIDDVFNLSVQAAPSTDFSTIYRIRLYVDLYFADRDRPPRHENFALMSRRSLEIDLQMDCAHNGYRPVMFEFFAFSAVTLGISTSLVSMLPRRRKNPPDSPLSPKLSSFHAAMCRALLRTIRSLEVFMVNNAKLVNTSLFLEPTDTVSEEASLSSTLSESTNPWRQLEEDAVRLSTRLSTIQAQCMQLFSRSAMVMSRLSRDFDDWRWRQLGEAFFFNERPTADLLSDLPNLHSTLFSLVATSRYIRDLGRHPLFCPGTDSPGESVPVIFEERFLPPGTPGDANLKSDVNRNLRDLPPTPPTPSSQSPIQRSPKKGKLASFRFCRKSDSKKSLLSRRNTLTGRGGSSSEPASMTQSAREIRDCSKENGEGGGAGTPCSEIVPLTASSEDSASASERLGSAFPFTETAPESIRRVVDFLREKQLLKTRLAFEKNYEGCLYSELSPSSALRPPCISDVRRSFDRATVLSQTPHLVVFVHGLEGGSDDLIPYRNFLRLIHPAAPMLFLMSRSNVLDTWHDFSSMGENLLDEIADYVANMPRPPSRISFIAHSLGGIIVRCALGRPDADWLRAKCHTLLTLNTPHLGLAYGARAATWGVALVQWWKKSRSIEQLSLRDSINFSDSFLYTLSKNKALSHFKYVLFVGAPGDVYVPVHSALVEPCKAAQKDASALGTAYREMLSNIRDDILSSEKGTVLIRYTVFHNLDTVGRAHRITGRAAHTAVVDDDLFIEKLLSVSALKYFK